MILLDTHVLIWLVNGDEKLSDKYIKTLREEQNKYLSVMSCWEISLLLKKNRLKINNSFREWIEKALKAYDIEVIDLDLETIFTYHNLDDFHTDPADKIIAATSISKKIPLLTFDKKLIEYPELNTIKL